VYFHGGGWVIADKPVYDGGARGLSKQANAVVVSVDYRQAPENKFPAAWDDSLAAYKWALTNAVSVKGDPKRVALAVKVPPATSRLPRHRSARRRFAAARARCIP
jgi:acetyl esterase